MIESKPHQLNGLAIQHEHTSFRLTDDEMRWLTDNEYYRLPVNAESNTLTKTSFLLKDKRLNRVKQFFDERMNNYIENVVEIKNKFVMTQSWSTITKKGESHHAHNHPNSMFSLVFYVSSEGEKSGNFILNLGLSRLEERWAFMYEIKNYNPFNSRVWEYIVNTGDIIIFPASVYHNTRENTSDRDRIVIGANYFIEGYLGSKKGVDAINIQLGDVND